MFGLWVKEKWLWVRILVRGVMTAVRSHIGSERPEPGPYKCMLTLTSKTCFGVMRGCQEQTREGDLGESPGHGWTGRRKADNILLVRWGVTSAVFGVEMGFRVGFPLFFVFFFKIAPPLFVC